MERTEFTFILKPSPIGGIGMFATHHIPKGMQFANKKFTKKKRKTKDVPEEFLKYCIHLNDEECLTPEQFDHMEIGWYVNHSDHPNVIRFSDENIVAARDIAAGEEIFIDYNQLNEPESLKERYYKKD